jgi:plastocyanin
MRSIVRFGGVLAAAVVLAACGGGDTGGETGGGGGGGATTLTMVDNEFQPADLTVSAGTELELTNEGQAPHTFTVTDAGIDEQVEAGQGSSTTIDLEAGTYDFVCQFHESAGMTGTLTVE